MKLLEANRDRFYQLGKIVPISQGRLKGTKTRNRTGEKKQVELLWIIFTRNNKPVFQLFGGPTGYESFYIEERHTEHRGGWWACAGGMGWDALYVEEEEMKKLIPEFKKALKQTSEK